MKVIPSNQLAPQFAVLAQMPLHQAEAALNAIGPVLLQVLKHGNTVEFEGFGLFKVDKRQDGSNGVRFIQTKKVRETLNG